MIHSSGTNKPSTTAPFPTGSVTGTEMTAFSKTGSIPKRKEGNGHRVPEEGS